MAFFCCSDFRTYNITPRHQQANVDLVLNKLSVKVFHTQKKPTSGNSEKPSLHTFSSSETHLYFLFLFSQASLSFMVGFVGRSVFCHRPNTIPNRKGDIFTCSRSLLSRASPTTISNLSLSLSLSSSFTSSQLSIGASDRTWIASGKRDFFLFLSPFHLSLSLSLFFSLSVFHFCSFHSRLGFPVLNIKTSIDRVCVHCVWLCVCFFCLLLLVVLCGKSSVSHQWLYFSLYSLSHFAQAPHAFFSSCSFLCSTQFFFLWFQSFFYPSHFFIYFFWTFLTYLLIYGCEVPVPVYTR